LRTVPIGRLRTVLCQCEQFADAVMRLHWVAQPNLGVDLIAIAPAVTHAPYHPAVFQVAEDLMDRALRDADDGGKIADARRGIAREAEQHVRVVG